MGFMRALAWVLLAGCAFHAGNPGASDASGSGDSGGDSRGDSSPLGKRRVKLTFHNATSEALVDFAALVVLDATRIEYSDCQPSGADLRFFDSDDTTPLPYEIEAWNAGAKSYVWVNVPQIDLGDADFIYMHYGDPQATDAQDPPAVWTHAQGIYHLAEDPGPGNAGDIRDSSSAANHGTASAAMTSSDLVDAAIGKGLRLEGNNTGVTAASTALGTYTWSMWLQGDAAPVTGSGNKEPLNEDPNFDFAWDHNSAAFTGAAAQEDETPAWHAVHAGTLAGRTWYHLSATYDGSSTLCAYLDGAMNACASSGAPLAPGGQLVIGAATSVQASFTGYIDEVRIYDVAQSPARIAAEHASQRADDANPFVTFGAPEAVP